MTCSHAVTLACIRHPTSIPSPSVSNPTILSPCRRRKHVRSKLDILQQLFLTANLPNPQHSNSHPNRKFPFGYNTITPSAHDVYRGVNYVRMYQLLLILRSDCHQKTYALLTFSRFWCPAIRYREVWQVIDKVSMELAPPSSVQTYFLEVKESSSLIFATVNFLCSHINDGILCGIRNLTLSSTSLQFTLLTVVAVCSKLFTASQNNKYINNFKSSPFSKQRDKYFRVTFTLPFLNHFFNMKCSMTGFSRPRTVTVRLTSCRRLCFCSRGSGNGERKTHQS